jgi:hypothetical protein
MLVPVRIVTAVQQPIPGVISVLDGVLIGAGDQDYLGLAGLAAAAVFAAAAVVVIAGQGGLVSCGWRSRRGCWPFRHPHAARVRPAVAGDGRGAAVTQSQVMSRENLPRAGTVEASHALKVQPAVPSTGKVNSRSCDGTLLRFPNDLAQW